MSFEDKIKEWVILDNQMKSLNDKLRDLREKKSSVNEQIHKYANNNHYAMVIVCPQQPI